VSAGIGRTPRGAVAGGMVDSGRRGNRPSTRAGNRRYPNLAFGAPSQGEPLVALRRGTRGGSIEQPKSGGLVRVAGQSSSASAARPLDWDAWRGTLIRVAGHGFFARRLEGANSLFPGAGRDRILDVVRRVELPVAVVDGPPCKAEQACPVPSPLPCLDDDAAVGAWTGRGAGGARPTLRPVRAHGEGAARRLTAGAGRATPGRYARRRIRSSPHFRAQRPEVL